MALEVFHDRKTMDSESWHFLSEHLQRPIEEKLMGLSPKSSEGTVRLLNMVMHLQTHVQPFADDRNSAQWYDRLVYRLIKNARDGVRKAFNDGPNGHHDTGIKS